jgi:hypothetical protein
MKATKEHRMKLAKATSRPWGEGLRKKRKMVPKKKKKEGTGWKR